PVPDGARGRHAQSVAGELPGPDGLLLPERQLHDRDAPGRLAILRGGAGRVRGAVEHRRAETNDHGGPEGGEDLAHGVPLRRKTIADSTPSPEVEPTTPSDHGQRWRSRVTGRTRTWHGCNACSIQLPSPPRTRTRSCGPCGA